MTVAELIKALQAIDDQGSTVKFSCSTYHVLWLLEDPGVVTLYGEEGED